MSRRDCLACSRCEVPSALSRKCQWTNLIATTRSRGSLTNICRRACGACVQKCLCSLTWLKKVSGFWLGTGFCGNGLSFLVASQQESLASGARRNTRDELGLRSAKFDVTKGPQIVLAWGFGLPLVVPKHPEHFKKGTVDGSVVCATLQGLKVGQCGFPSGCNVLTSAVDGLTWTPEKLSGRTPKRIRPYVIIRVCRT